MAALGAVFGRRLWSRRGRCVSGRRLDARLDTQSSDSIEQFPAMPDDADAKLLQVFRVRLGRTVSSISFSRNAASYFPRPRLRSQTTMSMTGPHNQGWRTSSSL